MGGDPPCGRDPGGFPPPGGIIDHRETTPETSQWELSLTSSGVRDDNNGYGETGDLHFQETEYGGPVHC